MSLSLPEWVVGIMIAVVLVFAVYNLLDEPYRP